MYNRQQFTVVNNFSSPLSSVTSGVPQGSVLGPLLFLIYINDLPSNISSHVRIFADDCILYRPIKTNDDHQVLQRDLQLVSLWCNTWLMKLNVSKCKIICFSRKRTTSTFSYHINKTNILHDTQYKYLGVYLTSTLSWSTHIEYICANASRSLGYIRRKLHHSTNDIRKLAYLTFVQPQLEYAASIWSPHQKYLIEKLESIQNRAARFISRSYDYNTSITQIKLDLSLHPLHNRRDIALLSLFHKYIYNTASSFLQLETPQYRSQRLYNQFNFMRIYGKTYSFNYSALPRAIRLWNDLPNNIASVSNQDNFKHLLTTHLLK